MQKKGQLGIFLLIGLIIIIGILLATSNYFEQYEEQVSGSTEKIQLAGSSEPLKNYISSCIQNSFEDYIKSIQNHGGHVYIPQDKKSHEDIIYWYYEGPDEATIGETVLELEELLEESSRFCITSIESDYPIRFTEPKATVIINDNSVSASIKLPISIEFDDREERLSDFNIQKSTPLGKYFKDAHTIVQDIDKYKMIDLSLAAKLNSTIYDIDDGTIISLNESFFFGVKIKEEASQDPVIEEVLPMEVTVGNVVDITVNASDPNGDELAFSMVSQYHEIDSAGRIRFVADKVGEFNYLVKAEDPEGNYDTALIVLTVRPI